MENMAAKLLFCQGVLKPCGGLQAQRDLCFLSHSSNDPDVSSAQLLFCHCQQATDLAQPCRRTPLEHDLTVLNIHRHLKLMGAPLVVWWEGEMMHSLGLGSMRAAGAHVRMREVCAEDKAEHENLSLLH